MTKVTIIAIPTDSGMAYRAVAGDRHSQGASAGAALDALTAQLREDETGTLVVIQSRRPDQFFSAAQQQRLDELMAAWRSAHNVGATLPEREQAELEALVETELHASAARASALADELQR